MAALTGDSVPFEAHATLRKNGAIAIDALTLGLAAGRLTADAVVGQPNREIAAHVAVSLPDLAAASGVAGEKVSGSAELHATVSGTEDRPRLRIEASGESLGAAGLGVAQTQAEAAISWSAKPADPGARLVIEANGELHGIVLPEGVPRDLGRDLRWSLSASAKPDGSVVELTELTAHGAGIDVTGSGTIADYGSAIDGRIRVTVAELGAFSGVVGHKIGGKLTLDVTAEQHGGGSRARQGRRQRRKPRHRGPRRECADRPLGCDCRLRRTRGQRHRAPRPPRRDRRQNGDWRERAV